MNCVMAETLFPRSVISSAGMQQGNCPAVGGAVAMLWSGFSPAYRTSSSVGRRHGSDNIVSLRARLGIGCRVPDVAFRSAIAFAPFRERTLQEPLLKPSLEIWPVPEIFVDGHAGFMLC